MNRAARRFVFCTLLGGLLLTAAPAEAAPPARARIPLTAQIRNPVPPALRAHIRAARFACMRQRNPQACQRMKALYAERRRIIRSHRAAMRQRGYLPPKRVAPRRR